MLGTQEQIEKQSEIMRKANEQASLQARIDAYGDLAKAYGKVVDDLQGQWQREMALFNQGNESIKAQERDVQATILNLKRMGMDERQKLRSQEQERDADVAKFEKEAAKGSQADEKELNRLYGEAFKKVNEVATAKAGQAKNSIDSNSEISRGEQALQKLWDAQKQTLGQINGEHKANADILLPSLEMAKAKLADVNHALSEMDAQLAKAKELKIELSGYDSVRGQLDDLLRTEVKTIVVRMAQAKLLRPPSRNRREARPPLANPGQPIPPPPEPICRLSG